MKIVSDPVSGTQLMEFKRYLTRFELSAIRCIHLLKEGLMALIQFFQFGEYVHNQLFTFFTHTLD